MSPLWGFKTFGFPVCYKHVAPLGLKTETAVHYTYGAPPERDAYCCGEMNLDLRDSIHMRRDTGCVKAIHDA